MTDDATIEVVYATPDVQRVVRLDLTPGMTAVDAVTHSGLTEEYPEILARPLVLGSYGEALEEHTELRAGDRVEICRPLEQDPRDRRWDLAATGRVMGQPPEKKG